MPGVSRIGDVGTGTCCCHSDPTCISMTGILVTGAGTHYSEGSQVSRIGDVMLGNCGHTGIVISGAPAYTSEGSQVSRVGDSFSGCFTGVIITGAATDIA